MKQAMTLAPSKAEAKNIEKQLDEYRKRAKQFVTQAEKVAKAQPNAGKEQLQSPLGGLGTGSPLGE